MTACILLVGISHRTAPVELRERLDFQARGVDRGAASARARELGVSEAVVLSTCNRAEIYVAVRAIVTRRRAPISVASSASSTASTGRRCAPHVYDRGDLRRGAPSVPGRRRPRLARRRRAADSRPGQGGATPRRRASAPSARCSTGCSTRRSRVGKRVRTETGLGEGAVSVSFAAVALARKIFGDLDGPQRRSSSAPARWASSPRRT